MDQNQFHYFLPYIFIFAGDIFKNNQNIILLCCLGYFLYIQFPKILNYFSNYKNKLFHIDYYQYQSNSQGNSYDAIMKNPIQNNPNYIALNGFLIKYIQGKKNCHNLMNIESNRYDKPIYIPQNMEKLNLDLEINNRKINIVIEYFKTTISSQDMNIIRISSQSLEDILGLQKYALDLDNNKKYKKGNIMISFDHNPFRVTPEWIVSKINMLKSRNTIFIPKIILDEIYDSINLFLKSEKIYKQIWQIPYKKGFIFDGLPGTGKTSLAYAIANDFHLPLFKLNFDIEKISGMECIIRKIPNHSILLIDDADLCFKQTNREKSKVDTEFETMNPETDFSQLLNILDGYVYLKGVIVILTTNYIEKIDKAILRPGRIDKIYKLNYCQPDITVDIINYYIPGNNIIKSCRDIINKIKITPSCLINSILIPNIDNQEKIISLINNYES